MSISNLPLTALLLLVALLATGCVSTSSTIAFSPSDVKLIPPSLMEKVLSPTSVSEVIKIKAKGLPHGMKVKRFEGREYLIVSDASQGDEVKVAVQDVTEIVLSKRFEAPTTTGNTSSSTGSAIGEALIYVPLIPVAIVSRPFLRAMGLDEENNSNEREKALMVYGGMSKKALKDSLGLPLQQHLCNTDDPQSKFEVWQYKKEQMLSGGELLFLNSEKGVVFFASSRFPSMTNCSPIPMN